MIAATVVGGGVTVVITVCGGSVVVSACLVMGGDVTVEVTCSVIVFVVVHAAANEIDPIAAPPTIIPASLMNSRRVIPFFFSSSIFSFSGFIKYKPPSSF
jgi:hypothetical protein